MKEIKLVELCKVRVRGLRGPVKDGVMTTGSFKGPPKAFVKANCILHSMISGTR